MYVLIILLLTVSYFLWILNYNCIYLIIRLFSHTYSESFLYLDYNHAVCAAPGSKTFQLLEMIHHLAEPGTLPSGMVFFLPYLSLHVMDVYAASLFSCELSALL